jgi:DNA (cytosine-5)-methyltransferase 1
MTAMFPIDMPLSRPVSGRPMIIDSFAGGGGASTGIEQALGRSPDVAINHDAAAISMHEANHPDTQHYNCNIWHADPQDVAKGRRVGLAWFSPDCTHHSKAKGGKPVSKGRRDLAWVVVLWAKRVRPEVIMLENVEEFRDWGPLGEDQRPCKKRKGQTFKKWVSELQRLGYKVEFNELKGCDYGTPTIRKRLFMVARCDGRPIVWPEPTHAQRNDPRVIAGELKPYISAADIIDWSQPCPSIFESKEEIKDKLGLNVRRPLADPTLKRIARGVKRYVTDAKKPYIVPTARGAALPALVQTGYGERKGQAPRALDVDAPLGTIMAGGSKHGVVAAFLAQHNGGPGMLNNAGRAADTPLSTLTTTGSQQGIVSATMLSLHGTDRRDVDIQTPHPTLCAGGTHSALVASFLQAYSSNEQDETAEADLAKVTVDGQEYRIADIGMRMLNVAEMYRAQGFPEDYITSHGHDGRKLTKTEQTRMCGNSVCPPVAEALVSANCYHLAEQHAQAAA